MKKEDKKLQSLSYYKEDEWERYASRQNRASNSKRKKYRNESEYATCYAHIKELLHQSDEQQEAICLGSRNNHEKDVFQKHLGSKWDVYSNDISPGSSTDFICDFSNLPDEWKDRWDLIYTNCPDHAFDATAAFWEWVRVTKPGGVIAIGFCPINIDDNLNDNGCSSFDFDLLDVFFYNDKNFKLLKKISEGTQYVYYIIRKV